MELLYAEWFTLGPDFGVAPDVNTEQYWVMAHVYLWLFAASFSVLPIQKVPNLSISFHKLQTASNSLFFKSLTKC